MKTTTSLHKRILSAQILPAAALLLAAARVASGADIYWDGVAGNWSDVTKWSTSATATTPDPLAVPGALDIARFNISTAAAGVQTLLGGDQSALGIVLSTTSGTASIRSTTAGQSLTLGASGIVFGTSQLDLGGAGTFAMVVKLAASQSWTSNPANGSLIQLNTGSAQTQQSITNATAGPVTLKFDGLSTSSKTITGVIDDGVLGGSTALELATTGGFGTLTLNGASTFSGGTTFTQGFLALGNATALGTGPLTFAANTLGKNISTNVIGGVTLTSNNVQNWNGNFTLTGAQNLNFGTGAINLGGTTPRTITLNAGTNPVIYTYGGDISGVGSAITTVNQSSGLTNAVIRLDGTNTYDGGTNINGGSVRFGSLASIPATGNVVINGGALVVGAGAFPTLASAIAEPRIIKTAGGFALAGDSSENYAQPTSQFSLGAQVNTVVKYTGTQTSTGAYSLGAGGGTIVFPNNNAFLGNKALFMGQGGAGTVVVTGQNSFNGAGGPAGVYIGAGTLEVSSINSVIGGTATSNLGAPSSAVNGTITLGPGGGAVLRYVGPGETTDRPINYTQGFSGNSAAIEASGTGPLVFTGPYSMGNLNTTSAITRNFVLRGINTGGNTFAGSLIDGLNTNATPGAVILNVAKLHRGNWTLTGANTPSGTVTLGGGTLTLDYATNQVLSSSTNAPTFSGGSLAIKGNPLAVTTQTMGNPTFTANTGEGQLVVTGNGPAASANLTLGNTWTRNANTYLNINLASGGQLTSSPAVSSGVVVGSGTVAAFTVSDAAGTDFATVSGGLVTKLNAVNPLPATGGAATDNDVLTGDLTLTGAVSANTLRIANTVPGTLTLGANSVTVARSVILMSGSADYTVTGTRLSGAASTLVLSHFGTGKLSVGAAITDGGGAVIKTGPGLVDVTATQAYTGATSIYGGVLRLSNATFGTSNITLNTGGILELGADLNGATAGDFSRALGTGGSQIQWANGDGGFSAFGANRAVNLGGSSAPMVWGSVSNGFTRVPNESPQFVKDGFALLLSSASSDATLDFQNPINFVNVPRAVVVANGSATVDAVLSGVLSSSDYSGGLSKYGTGTLALTNANTYTGITGIVNGTLMLSGAGAISAESDVSIGGATGVFDITNLTATGTAVGSLAGVAGSSVTLGGKNFTFGSSTSLNFAGVISGPGVLTKAGTGTQTFSSANTYNGVTNISVGTLAVTNDNALGTLAGNTVITSTGSTVTGGRLSLSNGVTLGEAITIQGTGDATPFTGAITATSGANAIAGVITLTGSNFYRIDASGAGTVLTLSSIQRSTAAGGGLNLSPNVGSIITANAFIDNNGGNFYVHASGLVSLLASGNDLGDAAVQYGGNLLIGANDALGTTKALLLGNGTGPLAQTGGDVASVDLAGNNQTINALNSNPNTGGVIAPKTSRKITNSSGGLSTLTVGNGNGTGSFDGLIENGNGAIAVIKVGTGTQTFSGPQNYDTLTTSLGITNVDGSFTTGTATVNANATTNFGADQTLAALLIGDGATVTLGLPPHAPAPAPAFASEDLEAGAVASAGAAQAVPEPGTTAALLTGLSALLGMRRRRS